MSDLGERLRAWRTGRILSQAQLAETAGIPLQTFKGYELGHRQPGAEALTALAGVGLDVNWLLTGSGGGGGRVVAEPAAGYQSAAGSDRWNDLQVTDGAVETRRSDGSALLPARSTDGVVAVLHAVFEALPGTAEQRRREYVVIPTFNEPARAGTPDATAPMAAPHRPDLAGLIAIDPALIHRQFGCRPGDLCHIQVSGHSMSPTLEDGDTVLINTTVDTVATNGIYVLQIGSNLLIKRVQIKLDGSLVISGDNPAYPPETVAPERAQQLAVVGRMVWPRVR